MDNIATVINKLYDKHDKSFLQQYGVDLIIALIIIYLFLLGTTYYHIIGHLPSIKANWSVNKCNPLYLPFAGIILNDSTQTNLELIGGNFTGCVQNILGSIIGDIFKPIYFMLNASSSTMNEMKSGLTGVRGMFNKIRTNVKDTATNISGRTLNITTPIVRMIITIKNMIAQTQGAIVSAIYTLFGSFLTLKSLTGSIIEIVGVILGIIAASIVTALFIPFAGPVIAAPLIAAEIAILIPFIIIIIAVNDIFKTDHPMPPSACFGKYTKLTLKNNIIKNISDVIIGDVLADGSIITGTMKMSSYGHLVYKLNNIVVTGLHRVYHDTHGWIKVSDHPSSCIIDDYRESIVYCINTTTKVIKINNITFIDWDDLDDKDLIEINDKCAFVPTYINNKDIHHYLDNGLDGNTLIEMEIGTETKLQNIEVNDILRFGERVLGVIKIDAKDISTMNEYNIGNNNNTMIKCSGNIQIYNDDIGIINTNNLDGNHIETDYLYQLITDVGYFYVKNMKIYDYNSGIEKYLKNTQNTEDTHDD
jgi:uncharacterized protein (DUF697 family)